MKQVSEKPITTAQIKKIHVLLQHAGLMESKENLVHHISECRVRSVKHLSCEEARKLIENLVWFVEDKNNRKRIVFNAIWGIAWEMGIIYGETDDDFQMNLAKMNMFCRQRGTVKKNLSDMDLIELNKTLRQFKAMQTKFKNKINNK